MLRAAFILLIPLLANILNYATSSIESTGIHQRRFLAYSRYRSDFTAVCHLRYQQESCPLCGELHALRVHGYRLRCVCDCDRGDNDTIRVVVIRCETARAAGNRYTMRLFPDFLVPGCVIRLDHIEEAYEERRAGAGTDRLCGILGYLDDCEPIMSPLSPL
ncbi:hypothetical protein MNBD_BACTEROID01-774 [hydrothermal vent metagenome]|uniref:Uncharacterized protein n=1 Tax=hydrothermal vent metagenome TaxID=652676 RepID=A0A3B0TQ23_9ZZZZ